MSLRIACALAWLAAFMPALALAQEPVPERTPPARPTARPNTETMSADEALRRFLHPQPAIHDGAVELGLALALVSVEHETASSFGIRIGSLRNLSDGLIGYEIGLQDTRGGGTHVIDVDGEVSWQRALSPGVYPFLALGGGLRRTRVSGTSNTSHPVGGGVGMRSLIGDRAAFRAEYRFRRVLSDPVADFSEHQVWVSFSVFLRNQPTK